MKDEFTITLCHEQRMLNWMKTAIILSQGEDFAGEASKIVSQHNRHGGEFVRQIVL